MQKRIRKNPDFACSKKPKLDNTTNSVLGKNDMNASITQIVKAVNNKSVSVMSGASECSVYNEKKVLELNSNVEGIESRTIEVNDVLNKNCKSDLDSNVQCLVEVNEVKRGNLNSGNVQVQENSDAFQNPISSEHENKNNDSFHCSLLQGENNVLDTSSSLNCEKKISSAADSASVEADIFVSDVTNTKDSVDLKRVTDCLYPNKKNTSDFQIIKCNPSKSHMNNIYSLETTNLSDKRSQPEQSTAKVSLGNATISVPLLKPLSFNRFLKKNESIVRKVINIRGKKIKASPTLVQLSQVHLNPKTNSKIVQATLVGNKVQTNVELKPAGSYTKANLTQTTQCSTVAVTALPRQGFEDEKYFVESNSQSQNKDAIDRTFKPTDNSTLNVISNKEVPRNVSYSAQVRLIDSSIKNITKASDGTINESPASNSISVTSIPDNGNSKLHVPSSKSSRKPLILSKAISSSESVGGEMNDIYLSKDNQALNKILEDNVVLRKQITLAVQNGNRFQLKVTKCPDEAKTRRNEPANDSVTIQQQKKINNVSTTETNFISDTTLLTNVDKSEKLNNIKSDETQNVLLKHLLQSSNSQRGNSPCNQTLAPRKLAPVRAPSLGVVSSLEAQLARPVIPPVSSVGDMKTELSGKNANEKLKKNVGDSNAKGRFELISRETSFLSTIALKQNNSDVYQESEKPNDSQNVTKSVETERKAVQFQPITKSNNTNLYKCVQQKELESGNNFRSIEIDNNQIQNNPRAQSNEFDSQSTANECNNAIEDANISLVKANMVKSDIEQNIELRKKIKRDYQKHKRQLLLNKDSLNYQRKKSRRVSKASEDYDEFIENKVMQMKQMFVLEVLEPFLNTFLGICSLYGYSDKVRTQVEYSYQHVCKDDFGKTNLKNLNDFYSVKPYGSHPDRFNKIAAFQNKFYDEEFPAINSETYDKLFQLVNVLKQQNIQVSDNISYTSNPQWENMNSFSLHANYPGIKFSKYININADRMSPIISFIKPDSFEAIKRKKASHTNYRKFAFGSIENAVIFTLSSFVAENILDILKDLKTIIKPNSPVPKISSNEKMSNTNKKSLYISSVKRMQRGTNIQNVLNGTYKCCRKCHLFIICRIVGMDSNFYIRKKGQEDDNHCENVCCIQYEKKNRKYMVAHKRDGNYEINRVTKQKQLTEAHYSTSNYKMFGPNCFWKPSFKDISNEDIDGICLKVRIAITSNNIKDVRRCVLCKQKGDSFADGPSRLLNYDVNRWVHLNCALWSNNVYETINGGLMNLEIAIQQGLHQICKFCNQYGASLKCFKMRCGHAYHLPCAIKEQCVFYKNKTIHCASHAHRIEKKNELNSIRVRRRVYIERDENRQVAAVMHHLELSNLLRIGNLTLINVGQLLPHQLEAFHTPNYIYPIGYKIIRFFWSTRVLNKRCRYICSIVETNGRPEFVIQTQEQQEGDMELRDISPKAVWQRVLEKIVMLRKNQSVVQFFSEFFTGEDLFGLSEPSIVNILESLPGVESLTDYRFKYGRNPLLELPLALNPSGSARTEPKQRHNMNWKKTHTQRTSSVNLKLSLSPSSLVAGEVACPYSKQFVHSKSSQYRKMKQEWRNNVYLARSKIQGLGLYAARDLEKHTMVIEYIGQVIRTEVSELREKQYDLKNRGIYMFRLDEERVVDATLSGGLARYINHSCNPNCVTEIVDVDREYRIIIFAKRRINKGEELSYDYKFDIEDDAHKISCMCDAPNCRKWMN